MFYHHVLSSCFIVMFQCDDGLKSSPGEAGSSLGKHILELYICLIPFFPFVSSRAGLRKAGFIHLSGKWWFPWTLTKTWTSTGGTWLSSTRAESCTRGLLTSSPSQMPPTKPWRGDRKTPVSWYQVSSKSFALWWTLLYEILGWRTRMIWLMTAF